MKIDRRGEGDPRRGSRQSPHGGKFLVVSRFVANHAAPIVARGGGLRAAHEGRERRIGGGMGLAVFDQAPVAVDEDRLGEPLLRMGVEDAAEDFGGRRQRFSGQRRVEPLGEKRRPHGDLALGGAKREIPLERQMLERQGDDCNDRDGRPDQSRQRNHPPANRRGGETPMRPFERLDRAARPRQREAKRRLPAQALGWPFRTSVPVCRAYTRHRPSQTSPQITLGQPPLRPNHYDKNPCANLCPDP